MLSLGIPPRPGRRPFAVIVRVLRDYIASYDDINSNESLAFVADFTNKMTQYLINNLANFVRIFVKRLFRGSVGVEFDIEVDELSKATEDTIFYVLEDGAVNGTLALNLTGNITVQEVLQVSTTLAPSPSTSSQTLPTTPSPPFPSAEITVLCEDEYMTVVIAKSLLPGVDRGHLRLLDASCTATETSTHFPLTTPLTGCLTSVSHTPASVIYSNRVLEIPSDINDVVTRIKEVEISFSCQYSKSGVVSSVGWKPGNNVIMFNDEGRGNFTMALDMFSDSDFATPYSGNDFPVEVQIQQPLFFEVSVTTGDSQLLIRADHCYATPTQDRNSLVKYDLIQDGCPTDPSVQFLATNSDSVQRFTCEAFQFIANHSFVFVHCHVIICNGSDLLSECKKMCPSGGVRKRQAPDHVTDKYSLVQGPIHLARDKRDENEMELSDKNGSSFAVMMVLALACAVCLAGTVLILARKSRDTSARYIRLTGAESPIVQ
ncbi:hypothetical protein ACROYT_G037108 [Oculina patagonica]